MPAKGTSLARILLDSEYFLGKGFNGMHGIEGFGEQRGRLLAVQMEAEAATQRMIDHENNLGFIEIALDNPQAAGLKPRTGLHTVTLHDLVSARSATERLVEEVEVNFNFAALNTFYEIARHKTVQAVGAQGRVQDVQAVVSYLKDPGAGLKQTLTGEILKGTDRQTAETFDNAQKVRQGLGILKQLAAKDPEAAALLDRYKLQTSLEQMVLEAHSQTLQSLAKHASSAEIKRDALEGIVADHTAQLTASGTPIPNAVFSDEALNVALQNASGIRSSTLIEEFGQILRQTPLTPEAKQIVVNRLYGATDFLHSRAAHETLVSMQTQDAVDRIERGQIPSDPTVFRTLVEVPEGLTIEGRELQQFRGVEGGQKQVQFVLEQLTRKHEGVSVAEIQNAARFAAAHDTAQTAREVEVMTNDLSREWKISPDRALLTASERDYLKAVSIDPAVTAPAQEDIALTAAEAAITL